MNANLDCRFLDREDIVLAPSQRVMCSKLMSCLREPDHAAVKGLKEVSLSKRKAIS